MSAKRSVLCLLPIGNRRGMLSEPRGGWSAEPVQFLTLDVSGYYSRHGVFTFQTKAQ